MTHPHLPQLEAARQFAEIRDSAEAISKVTGSFPLGFRAHTSSRTMKPARRWSSSVSATSRRRGKSTIGTGATHACSNSPLLTVCIKDRVTVAGDYNLFDGDHLSNEDALTFLLKLYNEHRLSGHPS